MSGREGVELRRGANGKKGAEISSRLGQHKGGCALFVGIVLNQIIQLERRGRALLVRGAVLGVGTDKRIWRKGLAPGVDDILGDGRVESV